MYDVNKIIIKIKKKKKKTGLFMSNFFWRDQFDSPSYFKKN